MVNAKIGIFVGIAIAAAVGIAFAASSSLMNTSDSEKSESFVDITVNPSSPDIDDGALVGLANENYAVNEDGKRHYTLTAETSPVVSP